MIILASTSPTRQTLLRNAGIDIRAERPNVDERALVARNPQWAPPIIAHQLAKAKATDVSMRHPGAITIGADQVLAAGYRVFNKPADIDDCRAQLLALRGQSHRLISTVCCACDGVEVWTYTDTAVLRMRDFSPSFLDQYLHRNGAACMSSVGGYQLESLGIQLFENVTGDYFTILGLPLVPLLNHLRLIGKIPA